MALPSAIVASNSTGAAAASPPWRTALPKLVTPSGVLREVACRDSRELAAALGDPRVLRYLPTGPTSEGDFARFIRWVRRERRAGRYLCFAVHSTRLGTTAGLFQLWPVEPGFGTAELGFALDPALWGTGAFIDCATAVVNFAFGSLGVRRLECRSAAANERGTAALVKLGAVAEGTLRRCFPCPAGVLDHTMWSILADEWRQPVKRST